MLGSYRLGDGYTKVTRLLEYECEIVVSISFSFVFFLCVFVCLIVIKVRSRLQKNSLEKIKL